MDIATSSFKRYVWEEFGSRRRQNRMKASDVELEDEISEPSNNLLIGPGEVIRQLKAQEDRKSRPITPETTEQPIELEEDPLPEEPRPIDEGTQTDVVAEEDEEKIPSPRKRPRTPVQHVIPKERSPPSSPHFWPDERPRDTPFFLIRSQKISPRKE